MTMKRKSRKRPKIGRGLGKKRFNANFKPLNLVFLFYKSLKFSLFGLLDMSLDLTSFSDFTRNTKFKTASKPSNLIRLFDISSCVLRRLRKF